MVGILRAIGVVLVTIVGIASVVMTIALLSYIGGRIILPEMGLGAPDYGPWVAFTSISMVIGAVMYCIKSFIEA